MILNAMGVMMTLWTILAPPPPAPTTTTTTTTSTTKAPTRSSKMTRVLACIRHYESRGNYRAVSRSGKYLGAYQFSRGTWRSVGGSGNPAHASPDEQDARAESLYHKRGLRPWPTPRVRCRHE